MTTVSETHPMMSPPERSSVSSQLATGRRATLGSERKAIFWIGIVALAIIVLLKLSLDGAAREQTYSNRESDRSPSSSQPGLHMAKTTQTNDNENEVIVVVENATEIMASLLQRAEKSSDKGCEEETTMEAQESLGIIYGNGDPGLGVDANATASLYWFQQAIDSSVRDSSECKNNSTQHCLASSRAKYGVGLMYLQGTSATPQNITKAASFVEQSAQEGCGRAQHSLGAMYFSGEGKPQNYTMATAWYKEAAAQNITESQDSLGYMYMNGLGGLEQNYTVAAEWFQLAADAGNEESQGYLGFLYYNGYGVPQNDELAACWFQLSAQQGYKDSQNYLVNMIQEGRGGSLKRGRNGKIIQNESGRCSIP